jgi:hypothetical protein
MRFSEGLYEIQRRISRESVHWLEQQIENTKQTTLDFLFSHSDDNIIQGTVNK